ncbi:hypothetical protein JTB14_024965 [Gonioctena quinquepunctata]|nr:hypothetical protein JTB14_024965 [Gonioctena quinquepunctata]
MAGFRVTAVFPFNPSAVDYSKCISNRREEIREFEVERINANSLNSTDYKCALKVLEYHMDAPSLEQFTNSRDTGGASTSTLLNIWSLCTEASDDVQVPTEENDLDFQINNFPENEFDISSMPIEIDGTVYSGTPENTFILSAGGFASNGADESTHDASSEEIIIHRVVNFKNGDQMPGLDSINGTKSNSDNNSAGAGVTKIDEVRDELLMADTDSINESESNSDNKGVRKSDEL